MFFDLAIGLCAGEQSGGAICQDKPYAPVAEQEIDESGDWFLDLECQLVEMFHWSVREIDETDLESLIPFVFHYPRWKDGAKSKGNTAYSDQVSWM
jgi:hypothetical protein